jgi:putative heme-binding domain-containing protein
VDLIGDAGPLEAPALFRAIESFEASRFEESLVRALEKSPGISAISPERLAKLLEKVSPALRVKANQLLSQSQVTGEVQRKRLEQLSQTLDGGDIKRGRAVFFGAKAACAACHRIGKEGETIGPNLTGIGEIRTRRDLLEAIVFPSASFARDFEPFKVETISGIVRSGLIARSTKDAVYLVTTERTTVRIPRAEIEEGGIAPATTSIMPQGFDQVLQPDELRDLLAFLCSLKSPKTP